VEKSIDFNEQENLFGISTTVYSIKEIFKKFELFKDMWLTTKHWKNNSENWMKCSWFELNGVQMDREVQSYKVKLSRVKK